MPIAALFAKHQQGQPRKQALRTQAFHDNIDRRGEVPKSLSKTGSSIPVGPIVLFLFVFVVIGSGTCWSAV